LAGKGLMVAGGIVVLLGLLAPLVTGGLPAMIDNTPNPAQTIAMVVLVGGIGLAAARRKPGWQRL